MKMWYSCGGNGRDRLWENLPYSVHVWLTVRTRRTKKHAANEGRYLFTVICIWLRVCMGGGGGYGSREIPYFFFSSLLFLFRLAGNADVFSVVAFVRPNSDICEPEPPNDFCDVILFVLLMTTEIKE